MGGGDTVQNQTVEMAVQLWGWTEHHFMVHVNGKKPMVPASHINKGSARETTGEKLQDLELGKGIFDLTPKVQSIKRINWTASELREIC